MSASFLISGARLIDPASDKDATGWLSVEAGKISGFGEGDAPDITGAARINAHGLLLAPGLIDLRVRTGEPGAEHKETLASASAAAAVGGVTTMVVSPLTAPVIDTPALIDFIMRRARDTASVRVLPAAAMTRGLAGEAMSEIGLLKEAGAVLFSNGHHPIADARVMRRALTYAHTFNAPCAVRAEDAALSAGGVAHDGEFAGRLGLSGVPTLAETIQITRDSLIAEDTGGRLLLDLISSRAGLEALALAKSRGAPVSASVAAANLALNELDVGDYRTFARLSPPLRAEDDRSALVDGVRTGLIDFVTSAHDPQPPEDKRLPFAEAKPGAVGLETLLGVMGTLVAEGHMTWTEALRPLTSAPASFLGLAQGRIAEGAPADLILIDPEAPWACREDELVSKSKNTPFDGRRFTGRVATTIVGGRIVHDVRTERAA